MVILFWPLENSISLKKILFSVSNMCCVCHLKHQFLLELFLYTLCKISFSNFWFCFLMSKLKCKNIHEVDLALKMGFIDDFLCLHRIKSGYWCFFSEILFLNNEIARVWHDEKKRSELEWVKILKILCDVQFFFRVYSWIMLISAVTLKFLFFSVGFSPPKIPLQTLKIWRQRNY